MKKSIGSTLLMFVFLMVLLSACAPVSTPVPPTPTNIPTTYYWEFNTNGDQEAWGLESYDMVNIEPVVVKDGLLITSSLSDDPQIYSLVKLNIDSSIIKKLQIRMKVTSGTYSQLFFNYSTYEWTETLSKKFSLIQDGKFHEYIVDMTNVPSWKGIINQLRLDPTNAVGKIEIDYIRVVTP